MDDRRESKNYRRVMGSAADTIVTAARRSQDWLRSRPVMADVLFACLIAGLALAELSGEGVGERTHEPDGLGVTLVLVGATALVWRRAAPLPVLAFVTSVSCLFYARDYGSYMAAVGLAALYSVAVHEKNRRVAWITVVTGWSVLLVTASLTLFDGVAGFRWSSALSMTLTIGATILAGAVIRNKEEIFVDTRERAERAEADRQLEAERAVARERLRIAREMHDVVAHGMSLITVQAAAAQEIAETRPDDAARLMRSIEATGRDALADMRRMLGVLRNDDQPGASAGRRALAPQPTLADLDATIAHCIEAGTPADLVVNGDPRPLPPGIELAAFRIVQEALTNVVKHGGETATATVTLRYSPDELYITVSDTGRGAVSELTHSGSGHGLIGMRERVEIYDGQLTAGPQIGGGYKVQASLPLNPLDRRSLGEAHPERAAST